jgi:hypothetical protein
VKLTQQGDTVIVRGEAQGLTPGFHGFHVHAIGQCVAPFTSAGGHYNPSGVGHGSHAGDMPSLLVLDGGSAQAQFSTDNYTIDKLLDADGSAIIVHAAPDNFANIPTCYPVDDRGCFRARLRDSRDRRRRRPGRLRRSWTRIEPVQLARGRACRRSRASHKRHSVSSRSVSRPRVSPMSLGTFRTASRVP